MNNKLPSLYQEFIHLSKYSRFDWTKKRRETWPETVDRYVNFMTNQSSKMGYEIEEPLKERIRNFILDLGTMPSMRALMSAGKALERDNVAGFNCSYLVADHPKKFAELLYILACGTGAGYSVEQKYISQLPVVDETFDKTETTIVVPDSKIGWAKSLKELIGLLYQGQIPKWDLSKVRPKGTPLKTFGGRASGPEPLEGLFKYCVTLFKGAAGRRLKSIEVSDLMCKIAEIIICGGVRRSALICICDLNDLEMRNAKSGQWWTDHPERSYVNISSNYDSKPNPGIFMKEWLALYESKSGERGIWNREGTKKFLKRVVGDRRNIDHDFGANPCIPKSAMIETLEHGKIMLKHLMKIWETDKVIHILTHNEATGKNEWKPIENICLSKKNAQLLLIETENAYTFRVTEDHLVFTPRGYVEAQNLQDGDKVLNKDRDWEAVKGITQYGKEWVYDITVRDNSNFYCSGYLVHNCGEIILRPDEFCNLSEPILRSDDTFETIKEKVEIATILGTLQSTLTDFRFLSKRWKDNCDEERLLGVSLTGIMDCKLFLDAFRFGSLGPMLEKLRDHAKEVNRVWANYLGIPPSAAITCIKPSGNVSQLTDSSSGIHARWSPYYIRTVRADKTDPLAQMMKDMGFPVEDCVMSPEKTFIFSFPIKSPEGSIFRDDFDAIKQLEFWKVFKEHWCEHNPSITVYVKDDEWFRVADWVYTNWESVGGISFLPFSDHVYQQAPYQECTKEEYDELKAKLPLNIDWWSELSKYEKEDHTESSQTLACVGGSCELR